jgi:hypothetical protein
MIRAICSKRWPVTAGATLIIIVQLAGCRREDNATLNPGNLASQHHPSSKATARDGGRKTESGKPSPRPAATTSAKLVATIRLLSLETVRQELTLDAAQQNKLLEIEHKRLDVSQASSDAGQGILRNQVRSKIPDLRVQLSKQVEEALNDNQRDRLAGISIQVNGANALTDPFVAAKLKITNEQAKKIAAIRKQIDQAIRRLNARTRRDSELLKSLRAKSATLQATADKKVLALLTEDQKRVLASLKKTRPPSSLTNETIVTKLNISDAQKAELSRIGATLERDVKSLKGAMLDQKPTKELQAKLDELRSNADKQMLAVLTTEQRRAFESLPTDPLHATSLIHDDIAAKVNLTKDQKAILEEINTTDIEPVRRANQEVRKQEPIRKEVDAKLKELREEADKEMLQVLTDTQRVAFRTLKGRPVNIDLRQLQAAARSDE